MYLIIYDIADDKLRTHFSKFLEKYGRRLQYSVFEIQNSQRLLNNIKTDINHRFAKQFTQGDSVMIYAIPDHSCVAKFGYPVNEEIDLIIV